MHLSHFIRKWITAILNQISLAMLTAFSLPPLPIPCPKYIFRYGKNQTSKKSL